MATPPDLAHRYRPAVADEPDRPRPSPAIDEDAGDPLDGLVNLFDVGMILAIAFLIAGLGLTLNLKTGNSKPARTSGRERQVQ